MKASHLAMLAFASAAPCACLTSDDPTTPPGGDAGFVLPEAGDFDASVPDSATPDAQQDVTMVPDVATDAPVDAGIDTADAAPAPVVVSLRYASDPAPGVTVVFSDATGAILSSATSDANGLASAIVPAGSQVTALFGTASYPSPVTVLAVAPGDAITLTNPASIAPGPYNVSLTSLPAPLAGWSDAGAPQYDANAGPCTSGYYPSTPLPLFLSSSCHTAGAFPLLVVAYDATYKPLGFTYAKHNTLLTLDAGTTSVALAGGAWSALGTQSVAVTHVPASLSASVAYSELVDGVGNPAIAPVTPVDGGASSVSFPTHPGFADSVQTEIALQGQMQARAALAVRAAPSSGPSAGTLDAAQVLPLFIGSSVDTTTPARPAASYTAAGSLAAADVIVGKVSWYQVGDGGTITTNGSWILVAPSSALSVKAPALPSANAAWAPNASSTISAQAAFFGFGASFLGSYAAARGQLGTILPLAQPTGGATVPPLPVNGTASVTTIGFIPT